MTTATQLPFVNSTAEKIGRRLWRQQVLPFGTVPHPSKGELSFSRDVLQELVSTFEGGAMDQVAYTLVDSENRHTDDPERHRGEIRRLELTDEGLYAVIDPSPRGRDLLAENPRQPVSARITVPESGDFAGRPVLAHVAATPDPVAKGMKPGEWVDASAKVDELVDLSGETFAVPTGEPPNPEKVSKDADKTTGKDAPTFSDEERGAVAKFFSAFGIGKPDTTAADTTTVDGDTLTEADVDKILADALKDTDAEATVTTDTADADKETVGASLSKEDREKIDMATTRADNADFRAGKTDLSARLDALVRDGVPPAQVQAAREKLIGESDEQKRTLIDFANDRKPAAVEATLATLEAAKGTVNFSEDGTSTVVDEDDEKVKAVDKQVEAATKGWV